MRVTDALDRVRAAAPPPVQWAYPHEGTVLSITGTRALVQLDGVAGPITCRIMQPYATITTAGDPAHDHQTVLQPPPAGVITDQVRVVVIFPDGDHRKAAIIGRLESL